MNKSLDAAEESGAQALLVTGALALFWENLPHVTSQICLLHHSASLAEVFWISIVSIMASYIVHGDAIIFISLGATACMKPINKQNLKYQGDGRFFCNGMDLQLLGRQRLHYWNVPLVHLGEQLGNLLPRYISANVSQSTQIQTDAEKLMRRHMPRSTCQVSNHYYLV